MDQQASKDHENVENDVFTKSLSELRAEDIVLRTPTVRRSKRALKNMVIRWTFLTACLMVLIYCLVSLFHSMMDYAQAQDYYDELAEIWNSDYDGTDNLFGDVLLSEKDYSYATVGNYEASQNQSSSSVEYVSLDSDEMLSVRAKLSALLVQNSDLIGWITIPDTIINYPVAQSDDNVYYLNHSFSGEYLLAGTIFADYRNNSDFLSNYNTVLYGHNLQSGNMFSCLGNYFTKSFYEEHPNVEIYTMNGIYVYRIFNVSKVSSKGDYIRTYFANADEFIAFATEKAKSSVFVDENLSFDANDRILTLSTCTNAHNASERYCIQAVLVEVRN